MYRQRASRSRWFAGLIIILLHGAALVIWMRDLRFQITRPVDSPALLWVQIAAPEPATVVRQPARPSRPAIARESAVTAPAPDLAPPLVASVSPAPSIDWATAAERAVRDEVAKEQLDGEKRKRMGAAPFSNFNTWRAALGNPTPRFPWSRQPLSKNFDVDFDRESLTTTVSIGKRCKILLVWILPIWGCAVGWMDPDAGRGDVFDRKYRVPELEIPPPLVEKPEP